MYQRMTALRVLKEARLEGPRKERVTAFCRFLEENREICWEDAAKAFRAEYYDAFDDVVSLLLNTHDALIISNVLRQIDPKNKKEVERIRELVRTADPFRDEATLQVVTTRYFQVVSHVLPHDKVLPDSLRKTIAFKRREQQLTKNSATTWALAERIR